MFSIGTHSYSVPILHYYAGDTASVRIGDWSSLADGVEIVPGGNHYVDAVTSFPLARRLELPNALYTRDPWNKGDVVIGSDVWLGCGVKVMGGVTIGHGAVVAAWSTVTSDVAPYAIAAGVPAREVRKRFDADTIASLLRIAWWNWPEQLIRDRADDLASVDVAAFIAKYDPLYAAGPGANRSSDAS
jgi:acetyltransferase-like isoleucine patch superfamily enzyme